MLEKTVANRQRTARWMEAIKWCVPLTNKRGSEVQYWFLLFSTWYPKHMNPDINTEAYGGHPILKNQMKSLISSQIDFILLERAQNCVFIDWTWSKGRAGCYKGVVCHETLIAYLHSKICYIQHKIGERGTLKLLISRSWRVF